MDLETGAALPVLAVLLDPEDINAQLPAAMGGLLLSLAGGWILVALRRKLNEGALEQGMLDFLSTFVGRFVAGSLLNGSLVAPVLLIVSGMTVTAAYLAQHGPDFANRLGEAVAPAAGVLLVTALVTLFTVILLGRPKLAMPAHRRDHPGLAGEIFRRLMTKKSR